MKISQNLILKGAAGGAAATAATTAAVYGENFYSFFITGSFEIVDETEKRATLGLPGGEECKLPDWYVKGPVICELDANKLKNINFLGKNGSSTLTVEGSQNFTLAVERIWGNEVFERGYRFILKPKEGNNDATIKQNSNTFFYLGKDMNLEFKIKEEGEKWYLERAWNEKTIREKIGLDCQSDGVCTLSGGRKINVMVGDSKVEGISNLSGGTIKLYKNSKDYQQGLKFSIENNDIPLSSTAAIKKLERDETYEIKQVGDKWYLSRKTSAIDAINENLKGLGLPATCKMKENGETEGCELNKSKLESINFDGKAQGETLTAEGADGVTLKLERTNKGDDKYPHEVKIIFENTKEVTIKKNGSSPAFINWKERTNTEYKIKESGGSKTLEKAWKLSDLAEKVGLTQCNNSGGNNCTVLGPMKVKDGKKMTSNRSLPDYSSTLKREENQAEYNQGFKFTAETDITFNGGSQDGIAGLKSGATYEIRELNWRGKKEWFLVKKTLSTKEQEIIKKINEKIKDVGIDKDGCRFKGDEEILKCQLSETELKKVKFKEKGSKGLTFTSSGNNFNLEISRDLGKESPKFFLFKSPSEVKTTDSQETIFKNGVDAKFEIKADGAGSALEKIVEQAQK